jgi:hypothetical protein
MARAIFRIEHRIGIPAPAHAVWDVLKDLEGWGAWNPTYPRIEGQLRIGETLTVTETLPGFEPEITLPTVVDWVPEAQIIWRSAQSFGFLKRLRYFEIDALSDEGCIFASGEDWYGRPARYVTADRRRAMRAGFEAMSEALKARALAVWRPSPPAPTSSAG